jgi:DegV family protein with EDD domain
MIRIITDTACDLPKELTEQYGIRVLPMNITFGEETFADQEEISNEVFFERLSSGKEFPTTSYPSIGRFQLAVEEELAAGNDVLVITIARALSGCYDSVRILLEDYPAERVCVFDSQSATLGEGAIVLAAARLVAEGKSYAEVKAAMPEFIERSAGYGAINNLVYLARGGRISSTTATVAKALNIKPVINICPDGSLEVAQKVHGMGKALSWLAARLKQDGTDYSEGTLFVSYIVQKESAEKLLEELQADKELKLGEVIFCQIGPTVGTHLGPGCVALFYLRP